MKKKVQSKPMKEILSRIKCKEIEIVEMWKYLDIHWSVFPAIYRNGQRWMRLSAFIPMASPF